MKIYKIQLPVATNNPHALALIYDEEHEEEIYMPVEDYCLQKFMQKRLKAFVYGKIVVHEGTEHFGFAEEAPWQDW